MPRVLITPVYLQGVEGRHGEILQQAGFELCHPPAGADLRDSAVLIKQLQGIDAVLASVEPYSAEVLAACHLRVIARSGVGYDSVDVAAATRAGVAVTYTPGANSAGVAEHAVALLLAVTHGFPGRDRQVRAGLWQRKPMDRLADKTIGLVGLGAIGREVATRCRALGMTVIAADPVCEEDWAARHEIRLVSLEDLLATADVVSLHLPCNDQTAGLFDAEVFGRMKPGAFFINTARGGLVDEDALVEALKTERLAGAGLDVFQQEPLPADHPLLAIDTVLLCPHMGGLDQQSLEAMSILAADSIAQIYQGGWPEDRIVNAAALDGWTW